MKFEPSGFFKKHKRKGLDDLKETRVRSLGDLEKDSEGKKSQVRERHVDL